MMRMLDEGLFDARRDGGAHPMRPAPPVTLFCAIAAWLFALAWFALSYDESRPLPEGLESGVWTFEAIDDAREGDYGYSVSAHAFKDGLRYDVRVLYEEGRRFMAHERFEAQVSFEAFSPQNALRLSEQGLVADAYAKGEAVAVAGGVLAPIVELRSWASGLFDGAGTPGAALLRALLTGDRVDLDRDGLYDDMKTIGLAHMVAVSGSHLCVVAAMAGFAMKTAGLRKRTCAVVLSALYAAYAVFTGLSAPVIRAAVMSSVVVSSIWARRRSSSLSALSVCVCVLIAVDPYNALSLSFFLSVASTFGVIVLAPLFCSWTLRASAGRFRAACEALSLTVAASLPMAPVTVAVFSRLSLIAPFANFVAAPVFSVLLAAGLAALALAAFAPVWGGIAVAALSRAADLFCVASSCAAKVPYAAVPLTGDGFSCGVATALFVGIVWAWWPRLRAKTIRVAFGALACALAAAAIVFPRGAGDEIVMLDVGQGDAFLIRSQGASLLVDTGNQEQRLLSALARHKAASFDAVAISHHDDDHCGCLELLAPNIAGDVLLCEETFACGCDDCEELVATAGRTVGEDRVRGVGAGDTVEVGRFVCTAIWPYSFEEEGGNADSLCFLVEYDAEGDGRPESSVLLTGDAEAKQIEEMMDKASVASVDIVKAGHHGSKAGVADGFSERVGAQAVLISAGADNRYGHPSKEAIEEFESAGMAVFRTDEQGDAVCRFEGDRISVATQR